MKDMMGKGVGSCRQLCIFFSFFFLGFWTRSGTGKGQRIRGRGGRMSFCGWCFFLRGNKGNWVGSLLNKALGIGIEMDERMDTCMNTK